LLTFFGEAKKVSALSGAQPDTPPRQGNKTTISQPTTA
jgi:hypothetical protein